MTTFEQTPWKARKTRTFPLRGALRAPAKKQDLFFSVLSALSVAITGFFETLQEFTAL